MIAMTQLALIWLAVFVAAIAARKIRLTPVLMYLLAGAVLVNLGWLPEEPDHFVEGLAEVGIIVIMFALGFEEDNRNFLASIRLSWGIAFFGALTPFLVAYGVAWHFWQDASIALMVGLTMTATAVSLTMVSLKDEGLSQSPAATRIMTSAVLDDIASLALVAIAVPIATGAATPDIASIGLIIGKAILFFLLVSACGIWIFPHNRSGLLTRLPLIGRLGARDVLAFAGGEYATLTVLLLALGVGLLAHALGFHPAVGAYMAGLILNEEYFHQDKHRNSFKETRAIIDNIAFTWMGPVFFVLLGSELVFEPEIIKAVIPQTALLLAGIIVGQVTSAAIAARYTGRLDWASSMMVGFGMLGRAELAFVVINIAYVQNAILDTEAFYMLMLTIFWLNLAVPVSIRLWKPRYAAALERAKSDAVKR